MAETPTYNHFDIKRYLQHKMSPQEMHDFEKALMDDPFLADAMEGFSASDAALADVHLAEIEQQLTGRKEKTKVVPLASKKTTWWKAAAIVLVIVTGGVLSYSLLSKNENEKAVAQQTTAADSTKAVAIQQDSIGPAERPLAKLDESVTKQLPELHQNSSPVILQYEVAKPAPVTLSNMMADTIETALAGRAAGVSVAAAEAPEESSKDKMALRDTRMKSSSLQALNEYKGKVTDVSGEPVVSATIIDNNTRAATVTDINGNFTLKAPDSITNVTVNNLGYSAVTATINSKTQLNNIALEKSSQNLSEVVVTGYGTKRKRMVTGKDTANAEPVCGWKSFEQYLNRRIDSLQAGDNENLYNNENVVLEFSIDKKGQPTDIKVQEQVNKTVAGKAVEILTNGPKWKIRKKDKKVKVVIPF